MVAALHAFDDSAKPSICREVRRLKHYAAYYEVQECYPIKTACRRRPDTRLRRL